MPILLFYLVRIYQATFYMFVNRVFFFFFLILVYRRVENDIRLTCTVCYPTPLGSKMSLNQALVFYSSTEAGGGENVDESNIVLPQHEESLGRGMWLNKHAYQV